MWKNRNGTGPQTEINLESLDWQVPDLPVAWLPVGFTYALGYEKKPGKRNPAVKARIVFPSRTPFSNGYIWPEPETHEGREAMRERADAFVSGFVTGEQLASKERDALT